MLEIIKIQGIKTREKVKDWQQKLRAAAKGYIG
jgi:hypothetical protein